MKTKEFKSVECRSVVRLTLCRIIVMALGVLILTFFLTPALAQEGEKKVDIDKVPAKVKASILKAVGDGKLVDIGVFKQENKKVYEIEMVVNNEEFDVLFSSTGEVLKRTFEGPAGTKDEAEKEPVKKKSKGDKAEKGTVKKKSKGDKAEKGTAKKKAEDFQDSFDLDNRNLVSSGRNKYFILEPGYQLVLEGKEGEHTVSLVITVLDETKNIAGVTTRVMEEREAVDRELIEISRNFFAMCQQTKSIFYFGEEVDIYKDGKVIAHEGAWLHGQNNARAGMMMPGEPIIGAKYYQEVAPKQAMDRARIVNLNTTIKTPAGKFKDCLRVQEENPLDNEQEFKIHAPGIGLVRDEDLLLVKHGFINK